MLCSQPLFHDVWRDEAGTCASDRSLFDGGQLAVQVIVEQAKGLLFLPCLLLREFRFTHEQEVEVLVFRFLVCELVTHLSDLPLELVDLIAQCLLLLVGSLDLCFVPLAEAFEVLQELLVGRHIILLICGTTVRAFVATTSCDMV